MAGGEAEAGVNFIEQASMTIRQLFGLLGAFFEVLWSIALEIADKFRGREEV